MTSITVEWNKVEFLDGVPVTGYHLFVDDGYNGEFTHIYDGSNLPFDLKFTVVNLITGLPYKFKVKSENINGLSTDSDVTTIFACLKPSRIPAP